MNRYPLYSLFAMVFGACMFAACTATDFEVEDGWDQNKSDFTNVDVDTLVGVDASMYFQARIFPGLVDTLTERHTDATLHLDLSKPFVSPQDYGFVRKIIGTEVAQIAPQPIYSTGLFAGAGELVTITIPEENVYGLTVQVGIHSDDLSSDATYFREPIVFTRKTLHSGTNYVRFPLGGYIWIIRDLNAVGSENLEINISGAYAAADFVRDETDPQQWLNQVKTTTVPWLELRSRHLAISIDLLQTRQFISDNPGFADELNEMLARWDNFMEVYYESKGLYPDAEKVTDRMPYFPERVVFDAQLKGNVANHVDNLQAIMMLKNSQLYNEMALFDNLKESEVRTFLAALNSKYVLRAANSKWDAAIRLLPLYRNSEASVYAGETGHVADCGNDLSTYLLPAYSFAAADSAKIYSNARVEEKGIPVDVMRLIAISQLGKYDLLKGEAEFTTFNSILADNRRYDAVSSDEAFMFKALCDKYQEDMSPFYDNWGFELSDADRAYGARYDLPAYELWKIRPIDKDGMFDRVSAFDKDSYRYRYIRTDWAGYATESTYKYRNEDTEYDTEGEKKRVANLFDGNKSTYWHSYLKPYNKIYGGQQSSYQLPYYIVVDMKDNLDLDGVWIANGRSPKISKFKIQTTSASEFLLDEPGIEWTDVAEFSQTLTSPYNEQFFDFPERINARYLRIVFAEENLNSLLFDTWDAKEQKTCKALNSLREQEFAEFGTFYYKK